MDWEKVKSKTKNWGSSFLINWYWEDIIKGLQEYLASIQPSDIPAMVAEERFPPVDKLNFGAAADYREVLHAITAEKLLQGIADARPDLYREIIAQPGFGAMYIVKLRQYFLDMLDHPEKALAEKRDYGPREEMLLITCGVCEKQFPIAKSKLESVKECPYCKAPAS